MSEEDKVILPSDPEAATFETISGWVSRNRRFFGDDERIARWDGCTHVPCNVCGKPTPKSYLKCLACRDAADLKKFNAMPKVEWDGKQMLYSEAKQTFYSSPDDAEDELEDGESMDDLMLVLCEPVYAYPLDIDRWSGDLPEDVDAPIQLIKAIDAFNEAIHGLVLSWQPGKKRYLVPSESVKLE